MGLDPAGIRGLLLDLVAIPSVSPDADSERAVVRFLRDRLAALGYFRDRPEDLMLLPVDGDPLGRELLFAIVRAGRPTADTVVMTGHVDVVDVKVCGPLAPLAFDAVGYTARIGTMAMPAAARRDLDSGEWLFGRGVADMKCGVATATAVLEDLAADVSRLESNVAVLFVPDEENCSLGMLGAAGLLARLQDGGLRFIAVIDTEPSIGIGERLEDLAAVYTGSAGKINPFFYCVGREAHLGEYYEGFNATMMTTWINLLLEGDPGLADQGGGEALTPYACMKHRDCRREYSCSIPERSVSYYSYFTAGKLPGELLTELRRLAMLAQRRAIARTRANARRFAALGKPRPAALDLKPRVMSFAELLDRARAVAGDDCDRVAAEAAAGLSAGADERDRALAIVDAMLSLAGEKGPLVVVGFLMPWYPHRGNYGSGRGDRSMLALAAELGRYAATLGVSLRTRPYYEGISDLSYCGPPCDELNLEAYTANVPGYGTLYDLPLEALRRLDLPVLNLGPVGKDAHKHTERIHGRYAFEIFPLLLRHAVLGLPGVLAALQ